MPIPRRSGGGGGVFVGFGVMRSIAERRTLLIPLFSTMVELGVGLAGSKRDPRDVHTLMKMRPRPSQGRYVGWGR